MSTDLGVSQYLSMWAWVTIVSAVGEMNSPLFPKRIRVSKFFKRINIYPEATRL
jgi:hypothetical protein